MLFVCVSCRHMKMSLARRVLGPMMVLTLHGVTTCAGLPSLEQTALSKCRISHSHITRKGSCCKLTGCYLCDLVRSFNENTCGRAQYK